MPPWLNECARHNTIINIIHSDIYYSITEVLKLAQNEILQYPFHYAHEYISNTRSHAINNVIHITQLLGFESVSPVQKCLYIHMWHCADNYVVSTCLGSYPFLFLGF